jgi:hypothetical protein
VQSCLANGRRDAAEYLVSRGAAFDFVSAATLGRLDVVRTYFDADGRPAVTKTEMEKALVSLWNKGDSAVAAFLLDRGVDVNAQADGFTAVNMAATMGQAEAVQFFIARGAALEIKNSYGGTSLSGALWGALNTPDSGDYVAVIGSLLAAGARLEPGMTEWWKQEASSAPAFSPILQLLEHHS